MAGIARDEMGVAVSVTVSVIDQGMDAK